MPTNNLAKDLKDHELVARAERRKALLAGRRDKASFWGYVAFTIWKARRALIKEEGRENGSQKQRS